jgi:hypothetical protein
MTTQATPHSGAATFRDLLDEAADYIEATGRVGFYDEGGSTELSSRIREALSHPPAPVAAPDGDWARAIEAAAKVADGFAEPNGHPRTEFDRGYENAARKIAARLRALAPQPAAPIPAPEGDGSCIINNIEEAAEIIIDRLTGDAGGWAGLKVEAWVEGQTMTVMFHDTMQFAKFRLVSLRDKPSAADMRGEPA